MEAGRGSQYEIMCLDDLWCFVYCSGQNGLDDMWVWRLETAVWMQRDGQCGSCRGPVIALVALFLQ